MNRASTGRRPRPAWSRRYARRLRGLPSAGTYFITTDIHPLGESDGLASCRALPERAGVVAIPNAVFYYHRNWRADRTQNEAPVHSLWMR